MTIGVVPVVPTCFDDGHEDNDDYATATPVTIGGLTTLSICPSDDDWYSIDLMTGDELVVDLFFTHADGDIDLELFEDPLASSVTFAISSDDNEQVTWTATADGPVYIHAWLAVDLGPSLGNFYDLGVGVTLTPCVDDALEENDGWWEAAEPGPGVHADLVTCPSDQDWFGVYLWDGDAYTVDLTFLHELGDIDLELRDPSGTIVATSYSVSDDESATWVADQTGLWEVKVWLVSESDMVLGNDYDMEITVSCADDRFEENDDVAGLVQLPPSEQPDLRWCASDDDWYGVYMETGDVLTLGLFFTDAEGDLDVEVYDPSGVSVAFSNSFDDNESLTWTATSDGVHPVHVYGIDDGDFAGNIYDMDLIVEPAAAYCPAGDYFDPNDTVATAATLMVKVDIYYALSLCDPGDDDDYFEVELDAGAMLNVDIYFENAAGDMDLYIRDAADSILASSFTTNDVESVSYTAGSTNEIVYIHADMWTTSGSNTYDMEIGFLAPETSLMISEVLYDASSSDGGKEWVELYNGTHSPIDLSSYSIGGGGNDYTNSQLQLAGTIPPGGCWVVGGPTSSADNAFPVFELAQEILSNLQNSNSAGVADGVALFDVPAVAVTAATVPYDTVVYGTTNPNGLMDSTGAPSAVDVVDVSGGNSILRRGGAWEQEGSPSPNDCSHAW